MVNIQSSCRAECLSETSHVAHTLAADEVNHELHINYSERVGVGPERCKTIAFSDQTTAEHPECTSFNGTHARVVFVAPGFGHNPVSNGNEFGSFLSLSRPTSTIAQICWHKRVYGEVNLNEE